MAIPKLERLMNLIAALLHASTPITAETIRTRVEGYESTGESFRRQFERDKEDLREMGVPIRVEPVPGSDPPVDGYRIHRSEYQLPDPGFDAEEVAALELATRVMELDDPGTAVGLWKLGGDAGAGFAETSRSLATLPTDPNLAVLFEAATSERAVGFRYRDADRVLAPRALGLQGGRWYVSGHDLDRDEPRVFRLDRMDGDVRFVDRPTDGLPSSEAGFDLLRPWRVGNSTEITVRLLVDAVAAASVLEEVGEERRCAERADGSVEIELPVTNPEGFRSWVIGLGERVEVMSPDVARNAVITWLSALAEGAP